MQRYVPVKLEENVRTRHDHWTKDALSLWLQDLGNVRLDVRIAGAVRRGDVLFTEENPKRRRRRILGVLGELARGAVLFEPFRNAVTSWEVLTCIAKAIESTAESVREARRTKRPLSMVKPTALCIVTPSASLELKAEAEVTLIDPQKPGIYRMAGILRTTIVVVDKLPRDASTLWLRLLGRDDVQLQAAIELCELHSNEPLGDATLNLLVAWRQSLPKSMQTNLERDTLMNWQRVYEKWEQKTLKKGKAEGIAEGKAEGKAEAIVTVLESRGLLLTTTQRKQILGCKDAVQLDGWLRNATIASDVNELLSFSAPPKRRTSRRAA